MLIRSYTPPLILPSNYYLAKIRSFNTLYYNSRRLPTLNKLFWRIVPGKMGDYIIFQAMKHDDFISIEMGE